MTACDLLSAAEHTKIGYPECGAGSSPDFVMTFLRRQLRERDLPASCFWLSEAHRTPSGPRNRPGQSRRAVERTRKTKPKDRRPVLQAHPRDRKFANGDRRTLVETSPRTTSRIAPSSYLDAANPRQPGRYRRGSRKNAAELVG